MAFESTSAPYIGDLMEYSDPNRWVALFVFSFFSICNAFQWVAFASIAGVVKEFFSLSTYELNMLSMIYMIIFVIGAFFSCTTFERWGVREGVLAGASLNAIGAVLKFAPGLQYPCYLTMIVPQTLNSFAQLFVLSTPPLLAAQYFPAHRRAFATAVASTANSLGNALALLVPPLIVREPRLGQFEILFGMQMGACCLALLGAIFLLKAPRLSGKERAAALGAVPNAANRPERSPSFDAAPGFASSLSSSVSNRRERETEEFSRNPLESNDKTGECCAAPDIDEDSGEPEAMSCSDANWWKKVLSTQIVVFSDVLSTVISLLCQRDFVFLLVAFSIGMGSVWTFASILAQISAPFGVSEMLAGIAGSGNVVLGTCMAYLLGMWVDRHRRYKLPVQLCFAGSVLVCISYIIVMWKVENNTRLMDVLSVSIYIFAGIFQNTAVPVSFEFAMELSYPHRESVPGALLMAGANLASLIMLFAASSILGDGDAEPFAAILAVIVVVSCCVIGFVFSILPRELLRRREAEFNAREDAELIPLAEG